LQKRKGKGEKKAQAERGSPDAHCLTQFFFRGKGGKEKAPKGEKSRPLPFFPSVLQSQKKNKGGEREQSALILFFVLGGGKIGEKGRVYSLPREVLHMALPIWEKEEGKRGQARLPTTAFGDLLKKKKEGKRKQGSARSGSCNWYENKGVRARGGAEKEEKAVQREKGEEPGPGVSVSSCLRFF